MSFQAMAWAIKQEAPTKPKFVLLVLANYADERGVAWPSLAVLTRDTKIKRSTLIECLKKLVDLDLIDKVKRYKGNLKVSNTYRLKMPDGP
jgi:predicted AAA+ superfamily ATPase